METTSRAEATRPLCLAAAALVPSVADGCKSWPSCCSVATSSQMPPTKETHRENVGQRNPRTGSTHFTEERTGRRRV